MRDPAIAEAPCATALLPLVAQLAAPGARPQAAQALARALGAEDLVVLVRDAEADALVPAPGFAPTLDGGPSWRALVKQCRTPGLHAGEAELPRGCSRHAAALAGEGLALIFLHEQAQRRDAPAASAAALSPYLPLLAFAFGAEQAQRVARAQAVEASKAAGRAEALATALDAARGDASRLNAELRAEHARKDHFLAMLAHELRNPLSPLVSSLDLMRLEAPADATLRARVEVMTRHVRQLSQLVDDLLDVSRVSHGRIELRREPLCLEELVRDALEANQAALEARRLAVAVSLPPQAPWVHGDRVRLTQILSNLVHNAAKFTGPGGHVRVSARSEGERALIEVADDGAGIDAAMLPQIFTLFSQAPMALARSQGGLGIGLTLVRALAELHGGEVHARSEGPGKGAAFTVALPLWSGPRAAPATPARLVAATARALRILVVDDNEDAANVLGSLVRVLGHEAATAYSSAGALEAAAERSPDLIFLDIGLPDLDGYEVARRLRRIVGRETYLVALTGYGGEQYSRRAREAGFDEHLVKPATLEAIEAVTARAAAAGGAP